MPSKDANRLNLDQKNVVFIVYPNIVLLDLAGPLQVFTFAQACPDAPLAYSPEIVSALGGSISTSTMVSVDSTPIESRIKKLAERPIHTLIIVGGEGALNAADDDVFVGQIAQLASSATRVCSICSGALLLAATGILNGRRAVTHWEDCESLRRLFPEVHVELDPIFIQDGHIWTSAGITAGIDMSLAIITEDLGTAAALDMARSLVTPMVRTGGQSQYSPDLRRQAEDQAGKFAPLHAWISDNLHKAIDVELMAQISGMSPRTFSRQYSATHGCPPAKALEIRRVGRARELLETSRHSIKQISAKAGFHDDERMRRAFLKHLHTSPATYRDHFQTRK